jgi:transposase
MVGRHELTDAQWAKIEPLLPVNGKPGGQWADHRRVINGIVFRARTGVPWPDLPERFGNWKTVYHRHRRWSADGTWQRILSELQIQADADDPDAAHARVMAGQSAAGPDPVECSADGRAGGREWAVNIDSTSCRAHQHAAGARHRPPADFGEKGAGLVWRRMDVRRWGAPGAG